METIIFKARPGTREKLRGLNPNVSALLRQSVDEMLHRQGGSSAYEKAKHLCGIYKGAPRHLATSREYLKIYGKKKPD